VADRCAELHQCLLGLHPELRSVVVQWLDLSGPLGSSASPTAWEWECLISVIVVWVVQDRSKFVRSMPDTRT
jgi:hypothetical protein